ncbi:hypothetical protein Tco_0421646 [Tanacetum coccineum]
MLYFGKKIDIIGSAKSKPVVAQLLPLKRLVVAACSFLWAVGVIDCYMMRGELLDMPYTMDIFLGMDNLGYPTEESSGSQFGSLWAIAINLFVVSGKKYNWVSRYIFTGDGIRTAQKMFAHNLNLNFHGDHMPLVAEMLPPPQAAISSWNIIGQAGATSYLRLTMKCYREPDNDSNPDPNVTDDPLGGSFFASLSRSTAAPLEGTTSGGAADLRNLTALSTLVSEQVKKIDSLESELQADKLLFKDVMGKLVKRVKFLESKLKERGKNVILSESDNEEDEEQEVDSLIKLAKAAAIAADTSSVPADATHATEFPPSSSIHTDAFVHGHAIPTDTASDFSADPSTKGKSPMVEEDPPIKEKVQEEMKQKRQEEMKKKRQEDVINSAMYYTDADWSDIMGQTICREDGCLIGKEVESFKAPEDLGQREVNHSDAGYQEHIHSGGQALAPREDCNSLKGKLIATDTSFIYKTIGGLHKVGLLIEESIVVKDVLRKLGSVTMSNSRLGEEEDSVGYIVPAGFIFSPGRSNVGLWGISSKYG